MITGNGMLAKSLEKLEHGNITLFCSGVSDSALNDQNAFLREKEAILNCNPEIPFYYFSTISIFNPSKQNDPYIIHKKNMEEMISRHFSKYLIIRLPNMVGAGGNKNNLFPYFLNAISSQIQVKIRENAQRYLLGIHDLPSIVELLVKTGKSGEINVCFEKPAPVKEMYLYMCNFMKQTPDFVIENSEDFIGVDHVEFSTLCSTHLPKLTQNWRDIVEKYTSEFLQQSKFA